MSTDNELRLASRDWLSAVLDSADTGVIGVANWWPRATAALETAATASTYGEAVTIACRKLQIDSLLEDSARAIALLEPVIGTDMGGWQQIVASEAPYIVALTRVDRKNRAQRRKEEREKKDKS